MDFLEPDQIRTSVQQYIDDVLSGTIVTCRQTKQAVERHVRDLSEAGERGFYFDEEDPIALIQFAGLLVHTKGPLAGKPVHLEPWEIFIVWEIFGWKKSANGYRRFTKAYIEMARKNGKTTFAALIVDWCLLMDGEQSAEIYTAATKRDQAKIAWDQARDFIKKCPHLKDLVGMSTKTLFVQETLSKAEALAAEADTQDGLNPSCVVLDEYHAHPNGLLHDVLLSGMKARSQPLMLIITTAGFDRGSACYQEHLYCRRVLDSLVEADAYFGIIYTLDEADDFMDPGVWKKANPNLGVSIDHDIFKAQFLEALSDPRKENEFKTKHLNLWTSATARWITYETWRKTFKTVNEEALLGRTCFGAFDLSSVGDLTGYVLSFPPLVPEEDWILLKRCYVPQESLSSRVAKETQGYLAWVKNGQITATPGRVQDYARVKADILKDSEKFRIQEMAYDPYNAVQLAQDLADEGLTMVQFGQSIGSMSPAAKTFERLVLEEKINSGADPVLDWMIACTEIYTDANGNIKPVKPDRQKSNKRIDLVVCAVMSVYRASIATEKKTGSVYSERGVLAL